MTQCLTAKEYKESTQFKALTKAARLVGANIELDVSTGVYSVEYTRVNGTSSNSFQPRWDASYTFEISYIMFRYLMIYVPEKETTPSNGDSIIKPPMIDCISAEEYKKSVDFKELTKIAQLAGLTIELDGSSGCFSINTLSKKNSFRTLEWGKWPIYHVTCIMFLYLMDLVP